MVAEFMGGKIWLLLLVCCTAQGQLTDSTMSVMEEWLTNDSVADFNKDGIVNLKDLFMANEIPIQDGNLNTWGTDLNNYLQKGRYLDVKGFGAVGDGITDDSAAFTAAFDALRASFTTISAGVAYYPSFVYVPQGVYVIESTIDATGIKFPSWGMVGSGAVLVGKTDGKPVIDALDTRNGIFRDFSIAGDETLAPNFGIQIGRVNGIAVASAINISNIHMDGYYTKACFYNYASELLNVDGCEWVNRTNSAGSYCLIQDGYNNATFALTSDYQTVAAAGTSASFISNNFKGCAFRKEFGGPSVYMSRTEQHSYVNCYAVSVDNIAYIVDSDPTDRNQSQLYIDSLIETSGIVYFVHFTNTFSGAASDIVIEGFTFKTPTNLASESVFLSDAGDTVTLFDADISVGKQSVNPNVGIFGTAARFNVYGDIHYPDASNYKALLKHVGKFSSDTEMTSVGAGTVDMVREDSDFKTTKGGQKWQGEASESYGAASIADKETIIDGGIVTATDGIQARGLTVTATADGLTTGLVLADSSYVTITSANVAHFITLPAAEIGTEITLHIPATQTVCEVRTIAGSGFEINGIDSDGTNQLLLVEGAVYTFKYVDAGDWIAYGWAKDGTALAALTPDAP